MNFIDIVYDCYKMNFQCYECRYYLQCVPTHNEGIFGWNGDSDSQALYCSPNKSGPKVIKLFSCLTQLSIKFQLLIKTKMLTNIGISCF